MNEQNNNQDSKHGFEKLRAVRIEKMDKLREGGRNPYPYRYEVTHKTETVREDEQALTAAGTEVALAGRVMSVRGHGKTLFGHVEDSTGRLQIYVRKDVLGEDEFAAFKLLEV